MSLSAIISRKLWVEKYRPRRLEEIILPHKIKMKVKEWIKEPQSMPHLLLIGTPGCGKTSLASILINSIIKDKTDFMYVNGSTERSIQSIREIAEFVKYQPIRSPIKIVFIDEGDNLTSDSFNGLRATIESYQSFNRFIITGNNDTFPDPLKSRFHIIRFYELPYEKIVELTKNILLNENVNFNEKDLLKVIEIYYPDLRKIINTLQAITRNNTLEIELLDKNIDEKDRLVVMLSNVIEKGNVDPKEVDEILKTTMLVVKKDKRRDVGLYILGKIVSRIERQMEKKDFNVRKYYNLYMLTLKYMEEIRNASVSTVALMEYIWEILSYWKILYVE